MLKFDRLLTLACLGWLLRSARGFYSLSLRSLSELEGYLTNTFPDETEEVCTVCSELVTVVSRTLPFALPSAETMTGLLLHHEQLRLPLAQALFAGPSSQKHDLSEMQMVSSHALVHLLGMH